MNDLDLIRNLVLKALEGRSARVWLFGSQARGEARPTSDVDVAIEPLEAFPPDLFSNLREALEDAPIIPKVDVVNFLEASEPIRQAVLREGVLWKA